MFIFENLNETDIIRKTLYPKNNIEDNEYIHDNRKFLWDFFDKGYKYANLEGFSKSCYNDKSLEKNSNCLKLVFYKNELIAASIYNGRHNGYKCVGITATTNMQYRKIGVKYVHEIVKEDIFNYDKFYWTICSGSLKDLYEKYGGIKIPSEYLPAFKMAIEYDIVDDNEYDILLKLNDGNIYTKTIYGFNSKETMETIINTRDARVLSRINRMKHINESHSKYHIDYSDAEIAMSIINIFEEERRYGLEDLSEKLYDILLENIEYIEYYVLSGQCDKNKLELFKDTIEIGRDILDSSTIIKIHKIN